VHVVALDRVVGDAELSALAGGDERTAHLAHEAVGAESGDALPQPKGDVDRAAIRNRLAGAMQDARPLSPRPPGSRAWTAATGATAIVGEAELLRATRH
jgi:hypothetical protein